VIVLSQTSYFENALVVKLYLIHKTLKEKKLCKMEAHLFHICYITKLFVKLDICNTRSPCLFHSRDQINNTTRKIYTTTQQGLKLKIPLQLNTNWVCVKFGYPLKTPCLCHMHLTWEIGATQEGKGPCLPMLKPQFVVAKEWEENVSCENCKCRRGRAKNYRQKIKGVKESEKEVKSVGLKSGIGVNKFLETDATWGHSTFEDCHNLKEEA
jgi:hypothetical protein